MRKPTFGTRSERPPLAWILSGATDAPMMGSADPLGELTPGTRQPIVALRQGRLVALVPPRRGKTAPTAPRGVVGAALVTRRCARSPTRARAQCSCPLCRDPRVHSPHSSSRSPRSAARPIPQDRGPVQTGHRPRRRPERRSSTSRLACFLLILWAKRFHLHFHRCCSLFRARCPAVTGR